MTNLDGEGRGGIGDEPGPVAAEEEAGVVDSDDSSCLMRAGVAGDEGNEQRAMTDLITDEMIPSVATPKFALIEKDFDARCAQRLANLLRGLRILGGVAQKYCVRGIGHA